MRPDRFSRNLDRLAPLSTRGLRGKFVTPKPVRSGDGKGAKLEFIVVGTSAGEEK